MNDLPHAADKANIVMFSAAHTSAELQENLSDGLLTIMKWVRINKLILNIEKTTCIVFSYKK